MAAVGVAARLVSAADVPGLYKVIMGGGRGALLQKCPTCLHAKFTLRDGRHLRGRGNTGAISAQAPSGGPKYRDDQGTSRV